MKIILILLFIFSNLMAGNCYAIDPVYEGANGIREKVFAPNCLLCHSSTSTKRFGAPANVNWDTYDAAILKATRAIVRAVTLGTMPPSFSPTSSLNDEQKAAMLAWQAAGFPKGSASASATFDVDTLILTLPVVKVGSSQLKATLTLTPFSSSPTGFGFILGPIAASTDISDTPALYDADTGQLHLSDVTLLKNGAAQGHISAEMVFINGSVPPLLSLLSVK